MAKLTQDVLASYLAEMPPGHIFDLPYEQFGGLFPPGEPDPFARGALRAFADRCGCDLVQIVAEERYELRKRA
jgi:hypothetical protein